MKKISLLLFFILSALLIGCSEKKVDTPSTTTTTLQTTTPTSKDYTKEDITKIFKTDRSHSKDTVIDCVVVNDRAFNLIGVVQYIDNHNNPCNFDFINIEGGCISSAFASYEGLTNSPDLSLTYLGKGKVSVKLIETQTLKSHTYYIEYETKDGNPYLHYY